MDLSTKYLGFNLPHPFIPGASPLADTLDRVRKLEDSGAAMVTLRSLFEEQIAMESVATNRLEAASNAFAESLSYLPDPEGFVIGPDEYLEHLRKVKAAVSVPVVASLNGTTAGGWLEYSKLIEQAGADAIELHIYSLVTDATKTAETVESRTIEMVKLVKNTVRIPVAVKLSPFYTAFLNMASRLDQAGADGLVLFNRFYHPDIDIENQDLIDNLHLSDSTELPLRLRWLAIIYGKVRASLAVTGGVHTVHDAVRAVMSGAGGVQLVSALLKRGPGYIKTLRQELSAWLEAHEFESLEQMRGSMSMEHCPDPSPFNRASYMRVLQTWVNPQQV